MNSPNISLVAMTALAAGHLPAQIQLGALSSAPVALVRNVPLEPLLLTGSAGQPGPAGLTTLPTQSNRPGAADYRLSAMFDATDRTFLAIDAFSTGNDNIPVDVNGWIDINEAQPGWAILAFGVSENIDAGSGDLATRRAAGERIGSDIYAYGVPGSIGIDRQYIGNVILTHPASLFGSAGAGEEIAGFDLMAPLLIANNGVPEQIFLANPNQDFFFSVTPASANDLNSIGGVFATQVGTVDPGAIYEITYEDGAWSDITVFRDPIALGLTPNVLGSPAVTDIDALAIQGGGAGSVIFSLADVEQEQLQVQVGGTGLPMPLRDGLGSLISADMGLPPIPPGSSEPILVGNNIDSLCGIDPELGQYSRIIGTPAPLQGSLNGSMVRPMSLCVSLKYEQNMPVAERLQVVLSGWHGLPQTAGVGALYVVQNASTNAQGEVDGGTLIATIPYTRANGQRDVLFDLACPPSMSGKFALIADFHTGGLVGASHPSVMEF